MKTIKYSLLKIKTKYGDNYEIVLYNSIQNPLFIGSKKDCINKLTEIYYSKS